MSHYGAKGKYLVDDTAGLIIEVNTDVNDEQERAKRLMAYNFISIRSETGMNRKEFADWLGIPYRTMQDWERGVSKVPDYVLSLIEYKVKNEIEKGNI